MVTYRDALAEGQEDVSEGHSRLAWTHTSCRHMNNCLPARVAGHGAVFQLTCIVYRMRRGLCCAYEKSRFALKLLTMPVPGNFYECRTEVLVRYICS